MGYLDFKTKQMKKLLILFLIIISNNILGQCALGSTTSITNGSCLTGQSLAGSTGGWMAGCNGGNHPYKLYSFTAGSCSQFLISNISSGGTWQYRIINSACSAYVGNDFGCIENVVPGYNFTISGKDVSGTYPLVSGTSYVLEIMGNNASTFDICYDSGISEQLDNDCGGATQLGVTSTTFFNGGDCSYSGIYDDATSVDPTAIQLCAGSLENTQWITFTAEATSIIIQGTNISCTGGGCGFQFGIFTGTCSSLTNIGCYGQKVCSGGQSTAGPTNPISRITWSGYSATGFTATISGCTIGEVFYFIMDGNADADCTYTLTGINITPLPIELLWFDGYFEDNIIKLKWVTSQEIKNDYFTIEKLNNFNWSKLDKVNGSGTTHETTFYETKDTTPYSGYNYYRLTQVDYNGRTTISPIISVYNPSTTTKKIITTLDILGRKINDLNEFKGIYFIIFEDNTYEKKIK
jgi:hypothetical protein